MTFDMSQLMDPAQSRVVDPCCRLCSGGCFAIGASPLQSHESADPPGTQTSSTMNSRQFGATACLA